MPPLTPQPPQTTLIHPLERALVVIAAAACVFLTAGIWGSVSSYQGIWPLPGLYFVELPAAGLVTVLTFLAAIRRAR